MTCKKHPRYRGFKTPRVLCKTCWATYLGMSEECFNCGCFENCYEPFVSPMRKLLDADKDIENGPE